MDGLLSQCCIHTRGHSFKPASCLNHAKRLVHSINMKFMNISEALSGMSTAFNACSCWQILIDGMGQAHLNDAELLLLLSCCLGCFLLLLVCKPLQSVRGVGWSTFDCLLTADSKTFSCAPGLAQEYQAFPH